MDWAKFYEKQVPLNDYLANLYKHRKLLLEIISYEPKTILEVGTGSGIMSIFLTQMGYSVTSIDNNSDVLKRAKLNNEFFGGQVNLYQNDAFNLEFDEGFDIAFNQGFFEHFSDKEINQLIDEQFKVAKRIVFSIPSKYYFGSFGDERLMSVEEWKRVLRNYDIEKVEYYGTEIKRKLPRVLCGLYYMVKAKIKKCMNPCKPSHILISLNSNREKQVNEKQINTGEYE